MTCALTVLHARGRRLAKLIHPDLSTSGYDDARIFDADEIMVRGLDHLAAILRSLLPCWDRCVVRGSLIHGSPASGIRRLLHPDKETGDQPTLYEVPRRHIAIDVEGVERPPGIPATDVAACALAAIQHLPVEFHGKACVAVATGQHGIRPDSRLRLWFWLDGAATRKTLQPWFFGLKGVDLCTFRPVQPCYTAAPVLADGVTDPIPDRLVVLPGEPLVTIRPLPPPVPRAAKAGQSPPPPQSGYRSDRYRDAALAGIEAALLGASEGQRHDALVAAATRMFELGSLSSDYISRYIRDAAVALNGRGSRQIDDEEVDELIAWAQSQASPPSGSGRATA